MLDPFDSARLRSGQVVRCSMFIRVARNLKHRTFSMERPTSKFRKSRLLLSFLLLQNPVDGAVEQAAVALDAHALCVGLAIDGIEPALAVRFFRNQLDLF